MLLLAALPLLASLPLSPHYEAAREHAREPDVVYEVRPGAAAVGAPVASKRVFGFLPYWIKTDPNAFRWSVLTDVIYFDAEVGDLGDIQTSHAWLGPDGSSAIVKIAHQHGRRALLSALQPGDLTGMLHDPTRRATCIKNLIGLVTKAGGDGLDIDFEPVLPSQSADFVTFMTELSTAFRAAVPGGELTMDVYGWAPAWPGYDIRRLAPLVDHFLVMGYNFHWRGSPQAGPNSPLTGAAHWNQNLQRAFEDPAVGYFALAAPHQMVLGVPYYGYDWPTVSGTLVPSDTRGNGYTRTYSDLAGSLGSRRMWDAESLTPWFSYSSGGARQVWYDDAESLSKKYEYVKAKELPGVMLWALGFDEGHAELWDALSASFPPVVEHPDAGSADAGATDAGSVDAGAADAGLVPDSGMAGDAGAPVDASDAGASPHDAGAKTQTPAPVTHGCSSSGGAAAGLLATLTLVLLRRRTS